MVSALLAVLLGEWATNRCSGCGYNRTFIPKCLACGKLATDSALLPVSTKMGIDIMSVNLLVRG